MLAKKYRLNKRDIRSLFKKAQSIHTKYFVLLYTSGRDQEFPQVAVVAGKKVGNAVKRNKAKRRVRQVLHTFIDRLASDIQIVIICKKFILDISGDKLKEVILESIKDLR